MLVISHVQTSIAIPDITPELVAGVIDAYRFCSNLAADGKKPRGLELICDRDLCVFKQNVFIDSSPQLWWQSE